MTSTVSPRYSVPAHILRLLNYLERVGDEDGCTLTFGIDRADYDHFRREIPCLRDRYLLYVKIFYRRKEDNEEDGVLDSDFDDYLTVRGAAWVGFYIEYSAINPEDDDLTPEELALYPDDPEDPLRPGDGEECHQSYGLSKAQIVDFLRCYLPEAVANEIRVIERLHMMDAVSIPDEE